MTKTVQLMTVIRSTIGPNQKFKSASIKEDLKKQGWSDGTFSGTMDDLKNKNLIYNDAKKDRNYDDQCNWWYEEKDITKINKFINK